MSLLNQLSICCCLLLHWLHQAFLTILILLATISSFLLLLIATFSPLSHSFFFFFLVRMQVMDNFFWPDDVFDADEIDEKGAGKKRENRDLLL